MSKVFEYYMTDLGRRSGYGYNFLVDMYNECMEEDGEVDWDYFEGVSLEHDW